MKLIDEKGRIFNKFNIIDVLIVLFIIATLFGINYKLGLLKKINTSQQVVKQQHTVKLWVKNVSSCTVDAISKGDPARELRSNKFIGEIIKKEVEPFKKPASNTKGEWVLSEVPGKYNVFLTLQTHTPEVNGNIKLGSKNAKVGSSLVIKGPKFQVSCYVSGVD